MNRSQAGILRVNSRILEFRNAVYIYIYIYIVVCIPIARQRLGKHMPAVNGPRYREGVYVVRAATVAMQW
jgi:hypothetical protein